MRQNTRESLRKGQAYYNAFTKYLPSLQKFAGLGFPETHVVVVCVIVIGGFCFFLPSSFQAALWTFITAFSSKKIPALTTYLLGKKAAFH